jgi:hypothetical protein
MHHSNFLDFLSLQSPMFFRLLQSVLALRNAKTVILFRDIMGDVWFDVALDKQNSKTRRPFAVNLLYSDKVQESQNRLIRPCCLRISNDKEDNVIAMYCTAGGA